MSHGTMHGVALNSSPAWTRGLMLPAGQLQTVLFPTLCPISTIVPGFSLISRKRRLKSSSEHERSTGTLETYTRRVSPRFLYNHHKKKKMSRDYIPFARATSDGAVSEAADMDIPWMTKASLQTANCYRKHGHRFKRYGLGSEPDARDKAATMIICKYAASATRPGAPNRNYGRRLETILGVMQTKRVT